jgi:ribosomal protein S18 acetylase RimI-like enzyme
MERNPIPRFGDALRDAEDRLSHALGEQCSVRVSVDLTEETSGAIQSIEHGSFREELAYSLEELGARSHMPGILSLMVLCASRPVAFLFGYSEAGDGPRFFLDTVATSVEGRGVGSILVTLALVHSAEQGYESVKLYTERRDDRGRRLEEFYERLGFEEVSESPEEGVEMVHRLDPSALARIYDKFIGTPMIG